jgi:beta-glucosidase
MPFDLSVPHKIVDARDPASKSVLFDGAVEGHVLVKNDRGALPLKSPKLLSVFGYDAKAPDTMDIGSGFSSWVLGFESGDVSAVLPGFTGLPNPYVFSQIAANGTIISGGGSGANTPPYISSPTEALSTRAYADGTALFWDFVNFEPTVYGESDACLVFINAFASEGVDRTGTHDSASDGLINSVADQCNNTIVVIHNAGPRLVDQFVEHENVTAIIFAHLPGQDSGRALVSLLYGDSTFSGKLPYSVPKNESAWGNLLSPAQPTVPYMAFPQSDFSEGVYIDYRAFDAKNITPRYEFGYGLSYTTFSYSNLKISRLSHAKIQTYPSGPILEGGHTDLWDVLYTITADITNSGSIDGAEVAQLYIGIPGGPVKQLRGYSKVAIEHGKTVTVEFDVLRRDLSEWDVVAQNWKFQSGSYGVWVGASSRILPLQGVLTV